MVAQQNAEPGHLLGVGKSSEKRELVSANINPVIPGAFNFDSRDSWQNRREKVNSLAIYPIGPLFYYSFYWNGTGGFSPEIRFAIPFNLSPEEVKRVKSSDCRLSFKDGETIFSGK